MVFYLKWLWAPMPLRHSMQLYILISSEGLGSLISVTGMSWSWANVATVVLVSLGLDSLKEIQFVLKQGLWSKKTLAIHVYFSAVENFGFAKHCMFSSDCSGFVWGILIQEYKVLDCGGGGGRSVSCWLSVQYIISLN